MFVLCESCKAGLRVTGDEEEVSSFFDSRDVAPCFACGKACQVAKFVDSTILDGMNVHTVSVMEAHLAFERMGLPAERECAAEIVEKVLTEQRIVGVKAATVPNTGRSVIESLELEDGTVLYLGSSVHGALVYRIRKPHRYVKGVEHAQ